MWEGRHVNDTYNPNEPSRRVDFGYNRYSRSAGVADYRHRRRVQRVFTAFAAILLVSIIGGAGIMFGQHILEMPLLEPSVEVKEDEVQELLPAEEPETPAVPAAEIKLVAGGDVIANGSVVESGVTDNGSYDFNHLFAPLAGELAGFDLRLVNQETNLSGPEYGYGAWYPLNAPQELSRAELVAGFNVILRANDHVLDNGNDGLHDELIWWSTEHPGTPLLGVAEPDPVTFSNLNDYVNNVYTFEKDGFKVAVLNHTSGFGDEESGVVSNLTEDKIAQDVQRARDAGAQLIVACPHWGNENNPEVVEEQTTFAQIYADNGVDVIIGTHPRVLQRAEVLQGEGGHKTVCFYSLGCLMSSLQYQNFVGGLAEITLARDESGVCSVTSASLKPVVTHRGNGGDFCTYLLSDYTEEIAHSGWDYNLTPDAVAQTCAETLGEGYDYAGDVFNLQL